MPTKHALDEWHVDEKAFSEWLKANREEFDKSTIAPEHHNGDEFYTQSFEQSPGFTLLAIGYALCFPFVGTLICIFRAHAKA